jgi:hypothetical protein
MKLSNKVYDIIKYCLFTAVPATIGLISTLGVIYHFDTEVITLTIGAIATFVGALVGVSNYNYNKDNKVKVEKVR